MRAGTWFDWQAALARAEASLAAPPAKDWIERPAPLGELVARFALPLDLCKPMNRIARRATQAAGWSLQKMKQQCFEAMSLQLLVQGLRPSREPLPGRPQVRCVRFSSREADRYADWGKNPVDRLLVGKRGIGLLADDRQSRARIEQWWEPGPRGAGFVYLEVRTG